MTLAEFIETESEEPVFIVDGPQPIVGTASFGTAAEWAQRIATFSPESTGVNRFNGEVR